jgi:hypothetical protein
MRYNTKFDIGDRVFVIWWNKLQSATIVGVKVSQNADQPEHIRYAIQLAGSPANEPIIIDENLIFASADDAINRLRSLGVPI